MISKTPISIDEIIANTKEELNIANTTEHDAYLEMKISEALRHLDAITLYVKRQCTLDIVDNKAELPKGFMKLLGARFTNPILINQVVNGVMTQVPITTQSYLFYVDTIWLNTMGCNTANNSLFLNYANTFQIQNGFIHFNSNNVDSGTIEIAFMGLNVDEFGRIFVYQEYERGLTAYACWKFTRKYFNDYPVNIRQDYEVEWNNQKAWIKAGAWKDDFQKNKMEISAAVNAMVASQTVNWV